MNTQKKEKFEPIQVLSSRIFHKNKGRNLVAALAIVMTTLMFTTLLTLTQSMNENLIEMTFRQIGSDAEVLFKQIAPQQLEKLAAHPDVQRVGESMVLGLAENTKLAGRQVEIRWADDSYALHAFGMPTTGRMPQAPDEAALDTITLDRLGIPHELGQTVMLEWRKDVSSKEEPMQAAFTLCGFWEGNESVYASMAWIGREYADEMTKGSFPAEGQLLGQHTAQVDLRSDGNLEASMERILSDMGLEGLEYSVNLAYLPEMGATALQETLPMYLGMALVFIAGYLIIYNIFQISVTADVQFYGKLKTLGTTTRQIKKLIYGQVSRLCVIAIPIGLLLGWLLGLVLVPVFTGILEGESKISANPLIFIGSAVFAYLTVVISCLRPARLAGKVSPIEALRMSDVSGAGKGAGAMGAGKRSRDSVSMAGMAWANLGRSKTRTVTVICSLSLGLVLLSCFYAKNVSFDMEKYLTDLTIADFTLSDSTSDNYLGLYDPMGDTLNEELVSAMESLAGVENVGHLYTKWLEWEMDAQTAENISAFYTEEKLADWATYDARGAAQVQDVLRDRQACAAVYGMDGIPLESITGSGYLLQGAFDAAAFAEGGYVLAVGPAVDAGQQYQTLPVPTVGGTVTLAGEDYTVMAVVYPLHPVMQGAREQGVKEVMDVFFILPTQTVLTRWPETHLRKLYVNVDDMHLSQAQEWLEEYTRTVDTALPVISRSSMAEQYRAETQSGAVMGNAVSMIIALVGILNFVNSMVTAIVSRKREFAMIQSIGMTKRQLGGMLVYEGLWYALITLAVSWLVSALAVGIVIRGMVAGGFSTFRFTLLPLAVCTPLLLLFAAAIPFFCFQNLEKKSIVERLRME